jgi:hypothetical protein
LGADKFFSRAFFTSFFCPDMLLRVFFHSRLRRLRARDCSGNPAGSAADEELQRKARSTPAGRRCAHAPFFPADSWRLGGLTANRTESLTFGSNF